MIETKVTKEQRELQIVRHRMDRLDNLLFKALEIYEGREKWSVTPEGKLVTVYPHPVINMREMRITGIKYKQSKKIVLPEMLQDRLDKLNADIKLVRKYKIDNPTNRVKPKEHKEVVARWSELLYEGVTREEIAEIYGLSSTAIGNQVKKYRELNRVNETGE